MSRVRELLFSVRWFSFRMEWHGGQGIEMGFIGLGPCSEGALVLLGTRSDTATHHALYFTYESILPITN